MTMAKRYVKVELRLEIEAPTDEIAIEVATEEMAILNREYPLDCRLIYEWTSPSIYDDKLTNA
jgi:hypothetical protein